MLKKLVLPICCLTVVAVMGCSEGGGTIVPVVPRDGGTDTGVDVGQQRPVAGGDGDIIKWPALQER